MNQEKNGKNHASTSHKNEVNGYLGVSMDFPMKALATEVPPRGITAITEPDRSCVDKISARGSEYSGGWIKAAWDFFKTDELLDATRAFEKARNGFGRGKSDWKCLEQWRAYVRLKALEKAPEFVRVVLNDRFYEQLQIPVLAIPLPITESGETVILKNRLSIAELLTNLRYYVLANEEQFETYSPILSRLALEAAVQEGVAGNTDRAEFYFTLAKDVSRHYINITVNVGNGYMAIGNQKKALEEFEKARDFMRRRKEFIPAVWLVTANLQSRLGHAMKAKNTMQDYFARAKNVRKARADALRWFKEHNAPPEMIALLDSAKI